MTPFAGQQPARQHGGRRSFTVALRPQRPQRLSGTGSPGRPPPLSHSSEHNTSDCVTDCVADSVADCVAYLHGEIPLGNGVSGWRRRP